MSQRYHYLSRCSRCKQKQEDILNSAIIFISITKEKMGGKGREIKRRGERGEKFTLPLERRWQRFAHYNLQSFASGQRKTDIYKLQWWKQKLQQYNYNVKEDNCCNHTNQNSGIRLSLRLLLRRKSLEEVRRLVPLVPWEKYTGKINFIASHFTSVLWQATFSFAILAVQ